MKIILASQSPRRKEILARMGLEFDIVPSKFDEYLDNDRPSAEIAKELAFGKAMAVAKDYPDSLVIGADTIDFFEGEQLGKPADIDEARALLKSYSNKTHEVVTGVVLIRLNEGIKIIDSETAKIHFKPFDAETAEQYLQTGDPLDKAGGYGIQSGAAPLVDYVEGDVSTIIGLPVLLLAQMLKKLGIESKPVTFDLPVKIVSKN